MVITKVIGTQKHIMQQSQDTNDDVIDELFLNEAFIFVCLAVGIMLAFSGVVGTLINYASRVWNNRDNEKEAGETERSKKEIPLKETFWSEENYNEHQYQIDFQTGDKDVTNKRNEKSVTMVTVKPKSRSISSMQGNFNDAKKMKKLERQYDLSREKEILSDIQNEEKMSDVMRNRKDVERVEKIDFLVEFKEEETIEEHFLFDSNPLENELNNNLIKRENSNNKIIEKASLDKSENETCLSKDSNELVSEESIEILNFYAVEAANCHINDDDSFNENIVKLDKIDNSIEKATGLGNPGPQDSPNEELDYSLNEKFHHGSIDESKNIPLDEKFIQKEIEEVFSNDLSTVKASTIPSEKLDFMSNEKPNISSNENLDSIPDELAKYVDPGTDILDNVTKTTQLMHPCKELRSETQIELCDLKNEEKFRAYKGSEREIVSDEMTATIIPDVEALHVGLNFNEKFEEYPEEVSLIRERDNVPGIQSDNFVKENADIAMPANEEESKQSDDKKFDEGESKLSDDKKFDEGESKLSDDKKLDEGESKKSDDKKLDEEESKLSDDKKLDEEECKLSDDKKLDEEESRLSDDKKLDEEESKLSDYKKLDEADYKKLDEEESKQSDDKKLDGKESKSSDDKKLYEEESKQSDDEKLHEKESNLSDDKKLDEEESKLSDDKKLDEGESKLSDDRKLHEKESEQSDGERRSKCDSREVKGDSKCVMQSKQEQHKDAIEDFRKYEYAVIDSDEHQNFLDDSIKHEQSIVVPIKNEISQKDSILLAEVHEHNGSYSKEHENLFGEIIKRKHSGEYPRMHDDSGEDLNKYKYYIEGSIYPVENSTTQEDSVDCKAESSTEASKRDENSVEEWNKHEYVNDNSNKNEASFEDSNRHKGLKEYSNKYEGSMEETDKNEFSVSRKSQHEFPMVNLSECEFPVENSHKKETSVPENEDSLESMNKHEVPTEDVRHDDNFDMAETLKHGNIDILTNIEGRVALRGEKSTCKIIANTTNNNDTETSLKPDDIIIEKIHVNNTSLKNECNDGTASENIVNIKATVGHNPLVTLIKSSAGKNIVTIDTESKASNQNKPFSFYNREKADVECDQIKSNTDHDSININERIEDCENNDSSDLNTASSNKITNFLVDREIELGNILTDKVEDKSNDLLVEKITGLPNQYYDTNLTQEGIQTRSSHIKRECELSETLHSQKPYLNEISVDVVKECYSQTHTNYSQQEIVDNVYTVCIDKQNSSTNDCLEENHLNTNNIKQKTNDELYKTNKLIGEFHDNYDHLISPSNMGQVFDRLFSEDVEMQNKIKSLGVEESFIVSENGEYAIVDFAGENYKVDKRMLSNVKSKEKLRNSCNLQELFENLEELNVVGKVATDGDKDQYNGNSNQCQNQKHVLDNSKENRTERKGFRKNPFDDNYNENKHNNEMKVSDNVSVNPLHEAIKDGSENLIETLIQNTLVAAEIKESACFNEDIEKRDNDKNIDESNTRRENLKTIKDSDVRGSTTLSNNDEKLFHMTNDLINHINKQLEVSNDNEIIANTRESANASELFIHQGTNEGELYNILRSHDLCSGEKNEQEYSANIETFIGSEIEKQCTFNNNEKDHQEADDEEDMSHNHVLQLRLEEESNEETEEKFLYVESNNSPFEHDKPRCDQQISSPCVPFSDSHIPIEDLVHESRENILQKPVKCISESTQKDSHLLRQNHDSNNFVEETMEFPEEKDAPVERQVSAPVERQVSAPVERQVSAPVERQVSAPVERQVSAPVERQVSAPVERQVSTSAHLTQSDGNKITDPLVQQIKEKFEDNVTNKNVTEYTKMVLEESIAEINTPTVEASPFDIAEINTPTIEASPSKNAFTEDEIRTSREIVDCANKFVETTESTSDFIETAVLQKVQSGENILEEIVKEETVVSCEKPNLSNKGFSCNKIDNSSEVSVENQRNDICNSLSHHGTAENYYLNTPCPTEIKDLNSSDSFNVQISDKPKADSNSQDDINSEGCASRDVTSNDVTTTNTSVSSGLNDRRIEEMKNNYHSTNEENMKDADEPENQSYSTSQNDDIMYDSLGERYIENISPIDENLSKQRNILTKIFLNRSSNKFDSFDFEFAPDKITVVDKNEQFISYQKRSRSLTHLNDENTTTKRMVNFRNAEFLSEAALHKCKSIELMKKKKHKSNITKKNLQSTANKYEIPFNEFFPLVKSSLSQEVFKLRSSYEVDIDNILNFQHKETNKIFSTKKWQSFSGSSLFNIAGITNEGFEENVESFSGQQIETYANNCTYNDAFDNSIQLKNDNNNDFPPSEENSCFDDNFTGGLDAKATQGKASETDIGTTIENRNSVDAKHVLNTPKLEIENSGCGAEKEVWLNERTLEEKETSKKSINDDFSSMKERKIDMVTSDIFADMNDDINMNKDNSIKYSKSVVQKDLSNDSSVSFEEALNILDETVDGKLKEASIKQRVDGGKDKPNSAQRRQIKRSKKSPLMGVKSMPNTPNLNDSKNTHLTLTKATSWQYSSDYALSKTSRNLIESIEDDILREFEEGDDVIPSNEIQRTIEKLKHVEKIPTDQTPLTDRNSLSEEKLPSLQDKPNVKPSTPQSPTRPANLKPSTPQPPPRPRNLNRGNFQGKRLSKSLHDIFTGKNVETDIDDIDEAELNEAMLSPLYKSSFSDIFETDVDKMDSRRNKPYTTFNKSESNLSTSLNNSMIQKSPSTGHRYIIVSKKSKERGRNLLNSTGSSVASSKELFKSAEDLVRKRNLSIGNLSSYRENDVAGEITPQKNDATRITRPKNELKKSKVKLIVESIDNTDDSSFKSVQTSILSKSKSSPKPQSSYVVTEEIFISPKKPIYQDLSTEDMLANQHTNDSDGSQSRHEKQSTPKRSKRDSWDICERFSETISASLVKKNSVEKGSLVPKAKGTQDFSYKHQSWNILELVESKGNCQDILSTYKRDSSNISYLFEKYQNEREALKKINSNEFRRDSCCSEFSEISSLSEGSSNEDFINEHENQQCRRTNNEQNTHFAFHHYTVENNNFPQTLNSPSDFSTEGSEEKKGTNRSTSIDRSSVSSPSSIERAEVKPFPSPTKPTFVPEISAFDDEDLSKMVIAKAASAVGTRRRSNRRKAASEEDNSTQSHAKAQVDTQSHVSSKLKIRTENKASDSGISDGSNHFSPQVERRSDSSNKLSSPEFDPISAFCSSPREDVHTDPTPKSKSNGTTTPTTKKSKSFRSKLNRKFKHAASAFLYPSGSKKEDSSRSYEHINSLPNLKFEASNSRTSSDDLEFYDTEDFQSESSLISDSCFDQFEGSVFDDELFIYPSLHLNGGGSGNSSQLYRYKSDSSEEESFDSSSPSEVQQETTKSDDTVERTVRCGYPPCSKTQIMKGDERSTFTSCPSCFTCYCTRACRRKHWHEHKRLCFFGRISYYVRSLLRRCEKETSLNNYLTNMSTEHYKSNGRGCICINFESPTDAKIALVSKTTVFSRTPLYENLMDVRNANNRHSNLLSQTLRDYDPEQEFVINIAIVIGSKSSKKRQASTVVRCGRISMRTPPLGVYDSRPDAYVIRSFTLPLLEKQFNDRETRRYYCRELSSSLKRCGVRLKTDSRDAYQKLCEYVDKEEYFRPLTVYGEKDGKNYKCIINPSDIHRHSETRGTGVLV